MSTLSSEEEDFCEVVEGSKLQPGETQEDSCDTENGTKAVKPHEFQSSLAEEFGNNDEHNTEEDSEVCDRNRKQVEVASHKFERSHVRMQTPRTIKSSIASNLSEVMQVQMLQREQDREEREAQRKHEFAMMMEQRKSDRELSILAQQENSHFMKTMMMMMMNGNKPRDPEPLPQDFVIPAKILTNRKNQVKMNMFPE
mmetsp:Transcript_14119/g.20597  ORF Transcript_14119/g.20597 Transcript_14119/m.20597 type:complete len:198 (+) Transcript_14119:38-631(+)|eukprot:CAMPEP_0195517318 /NCGR_PEP_ID=MMETSP0794_2-20130614/10354_1 /TAXON_ID=515487 /ORGANISM="Stephanopyxis turris, Strain CCMP 815" /LENGTH=197 /DNA_ID=CAMNT_0040646101 /DNA_START=53 /DNA_END=646 /DNA_ORIENTATION=-